MIKWLLAQILLLSVVVTVDSSLGAARAYEIAKAGCADECGGVKIPFPFGIGDGCFVNNDNSLYDDTFRIDCNHSTNPPIPFLFGVEVLSIDVEDNGLRVSSGVACYCHNNTKRVAPTSLELDYSIAGTHLSNRNKLIAVGCDTIALLSDIHTYTAQECNTSCIDYGSYSYCSNDAASNSKCDPSMSYTTQECNTSCIDLDGVRNGTCDSFHGCCEASIFESEYLYNPVVRVDGSSQLKQGCNYAFVSEVGWYNFSAANLTATPADCAKIRVPVVYDWYVSTDNMVCGSNTNSISVNGSYRLGKSYNCRCLEGYTGNPYLPQGCQDLNECADERLNDCQKPEYCENKDGGYVCRCPDGHHGNGTTTSPCIVVHGTGNEGAKPGCRGECGGVKIPFPFGIGDGCFAKGMSEFEIKCDATNPKPVLPFLGNREVLNISTTEHTLRLSYGVSYQCYKDGQLLPSTTTTSTYTNMYTLNKFATSSTLDVAVPFNIMATMNKFVAIGCVATAWLRNDLGNHLEVASACTTSCIGVEAVGHGTCDSALGCCEASIFRNLSNPIISVDSFSKNGYNLNYSCIYAFVGEVGLYRFSAINLSLTQNDFDNIRVPVLYDWYVSTLNESCSKAKMDGVGSYKLRTMCRSNTQFECVDEDVYGYRCQCLEGYDGNPYLPYGCQDIDECLNEGLNDCQRPEYCVNKDGGYDCQCPKGHYGNGTKTSPCIPSPGADHNLILGLSIGMCSLIGMILFYGLFKLLKRRKDVKDRKHNFKKNGGLLLQQEMSTNKGAIERTKIFNRSELEKATDNFNNSRVLGCGGQGTVYKGMLSDGTIVAVKKSKRIDEHLLAQFINEVVVLSQINHRNVVKLFGCCLETEVPLLVYEFVPNGTLYQHIHHPIEDFQMTWKVRFQIAVECAGAVAYLHSSCSSPIYHRDIKSSNILLDEKYKAKISDFGTSRSISIDKTHVTTCVQGTFGYLDPEFFRSSHFNEKSDVYSFGVVLLELLTSKKPIFIDMSTEPRSLATEFVHLMETSPNQLHDFLDNQVLQECSEEEIEALAKLIERCLSLSGKQRPTMREVAMTLEMIKSQHGREENPDNDQEITRQLEGHVLNDNAGITTEYPSIDTSSYTDSSYSTNLQSFDCN